MRSSWIFLVLIHNLVFSLLVILGANSDSLLTSAAIPITYWIAGWIIIFEKRRLEEKDSPENPRVSATE